MPDEKTEIRDRPAVTPVPINLNSDFHAGYLCAIMQVMYDDVSTVMRRVLGLARAYGRESEPDTSEHCFMFLCNTQETLQTVELVTTAAYFDRLATLKSPVADLTPIIQDAKDIRKLLGEIEDMLRRRWQDLKRLHDAQAYANGDTLVPFFVESQHALEALGTRLDKASENVRLFVHKLVGSGFGQDGPIT